MNLSIPKMSFSVPFTMLDLNSFQLITSKIIPGDISDSKNVVITEQAIPGLNYSPVNQSGMGNRHIGFTIPVIKRNNTVGNVQLVKQWESLRNKAFKITEIFTGSSQFRTNPKVLFSWGTTSLPLVWYVSKIEATHKAGWVNELGNPQYSEIGVELILDEESFVNIGEEIYRKLSAYAGTILTAFDFVPGKDQRTY